MPHDGKTSHCTRVYVLRAKKPSRDRDLDGHVFSDKDHADRWMAQGWAPAERYFVEVLEIKPTDLEKMKRKAARLEDDLHLLHGIIHAAEASAS